MRSVIRNSFNEIGIDNVLGFPFAYAEAEFMENPHTNIKQLILMITDFQSWIEEKSLSTKFISVLGM
ncbi:hypothetical protein [Bacillus changyiensis]|uniref:hypothetical protein n=1 Tax=Bacillus changyiensis TaxID=3004103 RepID=UPI0022E3E928|nr:hypothetical protein [Bacillus changyiensis]